MDISRARAVVIKDNKILLIHRFRAGTEYYVLPGGHIDEGETPEITVMRELKEETSIESTFIKKLDIVIDEDKNTHHIFLCEYISGTPKLAEGSSEVMDTTHENVYIPKWIDLDKVFLVPMWPREVGIFLKGYLQNRG